MASTGANWETVLFGMIGLALVATIGVLLAGVWVMGSGRSLSSRWGQRLMRYRVVTHALVVLLLLLLLAVRRFG